MAVGSAGRKVTTSSGARFRALGGFLTLRSSVGNSNLATPTFTTALATHAYDTHVDICTTAFGVQRSPCQSGPERSRLLLDRRGGVSARSVTVSDLARTVLRHRCRSTKHWAPRPIANRGPSQPPIARA